jgi:hypothetical protein
MKGRLRTRENLRKRLLRLSSNFLSSSLPAGFQVHPATLLAHCYPYNPGELEAPAGFRGLGSEFPWECAMRAAKLGIRAKRGT